MFATQDGHDRAAELDAAASVLRGCTEALDVGALTATDAAALVAKAVEVQRLAAGARMLLAAKAAEAGTWRAKGHRSPEDWLAQEAGTSVGQARGDLEASKKLSQCPKTEQAVREGKVSPEQAREITDAAAADPSAEGDLLGLAEKGAAHKELRDESRRRKAAADPDPEATARRIHRERRVRTGTDPDGTWWLNARGPAAGGAGVMAALRGQAERIFQANRRAGNREHPEAYLFDALVQLLTGTATNAGTAASPPANASPDPAASTTDDAPASPAGGSSSASGPTVRRAGQPPRAPSQGPAPSTDGPPRTPDRRPAPDSPPSAAEPTAAAPSHAGEPPTGAAPTPARAPDPRGSANEVFHADAPSPHVGDVTHATAPPSGDETRAAPTASAGASGRSAASPSAAGTCGGPTEPAAAPETPSRGRHPDTGPSGASAPPVAPPAVPGPSGCRPPASPADALGLPGTAAPARERPPGGPSTADGPGEAAPTLPGLDVGPPPVPRTVLPVGANAKIIVRIDHSALVRGYPVAGEVCEVDGVGIVDVASVRAWMTDAFVAAVLTDGTDVTKVVHLGRRPTALQTTALQAAGTRCQRLGCGRTEGLQIDHRAEWSRTRHTRLGELDWLCRYDHSLKTLYGWALEPGTGPRRMLPPDHPEHPGGPPSCPPGSASRRPEATASRSDAR